MKALALVVGLLSAACASATCAPLGLDRRALLALRADGFAIADPARRDRFLLELIPCLGEADPVVRDGIAYEGFAALLRKGDVPPETVRSLAAALQQELTADDPAGFRRPFAALALSEVARADRLAPALGASERDALVSSAAGYLAGITDYRGFADGAGWRHGVAHAADTLMQLAMNPALTRPQAVRIRDAIARQAAPAAHSYVHGESERLARPVLMLADRGLLTDAEWAEWFAALAAPAPLADWGAAFASEAGLARRHNLRSFALALLAGSDASLGAKPAREPLRAGAIGLLRATG